MPLFTELFGASSFEVILARQSKHSTTWDFSLWDFWFSMHFSHSAAWKISKKGSAVSILHAYSYRVGNYNCLFQNTAPLAFHRQQSPGLLCSRCFTPWFLTTALVSNFPFLASNFFWFVNSAQHFFWASLPFVVITSSLLLMNLHIEQFQ